LNKFADAYQNSLSHSSDDELANGSTLAISVGTPVFATTGEIEGMIARVIYTQNMTLYHAMESLLNTHKATILAHVDDQVRTAIR
jgi:hypothetical protein